MRLTTFYVFASLAVALFGVTSAAAQPSTGIDPLAGYPRVESRFEVFVSGLHGADAIVVNASDGHQFFTSVDVEIVGLPRLFTDLRWRINALSEVQGDQVIPAGYVYQRHRRDQWRTTVTDFTTNPPMQRFDPHRDYRPDQLIPPDRLANAVDPLAAVLQAALQLTNTGSCNTGADVVEGRKLYRATVTDRGTDPMPGGRRSIYTGPAQRCDFTLVPEAGGFDAEEFEEDRASGTVWLADLVDGMPPFPVRMQFGRDGRSIHLHLRSVIPSDGAVVSLP